MKGDDQLDIYDGTLLLIVNAIDRGKLNVTTHWQLQCLSTAEFHYWCPTSLIINFMWFYLLLFLILNVDCIIYSVRCNLVIFLILQSKKKAVGSINDLDCGTPEWLPAQLLAVVHICIPICCALISFCMYCFTNAKVNPNAVIYSLHGFDSLHDLKLNDLSISYKKWRPWLYLKENCISFIIDFDIN